ncbi:MAG TPA: AraC family transcriptional regulator [Candidatus Blautia merdavium]|uniref:AraC family transcriptional regulator n=1 Tax=Candidatus Blautia merdavium TaxID=2838494 RepID=A0A9D2TC00_9FIRM|nr:AraC family transcriptional regulator [Candidatus Blautia merdavium]
MFYENKPEFFIFSHQKTPLEYPPHIHSYLELVHVIEGELEMQIGQEKFLFSKNDIGIIFPNTIHNYHTLSESQNTYFAILNCAVDMIPFFKKQLLHSKPENPVLHSDQIHPDIYFAEKSLAALECREENIPLISAYFSLIFARIFPYFRLTSGESASTPPMDFSGKVLSYVAEHFTEDLTLSRVASHFGIGKSALSRIFSNTLGIHYTQYLNSLRVNYSQHLLAVTDLNILEIALESGYHNQQTYNRIFKEICGCTPKEFRRKNLKKTVFPFC